MPREPGTATVEAVTGTGVIDGRRESWEVSTYLIELPVPN